MEWISRVILRVVLDKFWNWVESMLEERAQVELQRRANEQEHRENTSLDDDDIDKRLRDGSA